MEKDHEDVCPACSECWPVPGQPKPPDSHRTPDFYVVCCVCTSFLTYTFDGSLMIAPNSTSIAVRLALRETMDILKKEIQNPKLFASRIAHRRGLA